MLVSGNISRTTKYHRRTSFGFHSGIEDKVGTKLINDGETFAYEQGYLLYPKPEARYTPDFILPNGIIVETKGYFTSEDRTKHLLLQKTYPDIEIRFLFPRNKSRNKLSPTSKTTYAMWCVKHGFKFAETYIPEEWLREPPNEKSLKALQANLHKKGARKKYAKSTL